MCILAHGTRSVPLDYRYAHLFCDNAHTRSRGFSSTVSYSLSFNYATKIFSILVCLHHSPFISSPTCISSLNSTKIALVNQFTAKFYIPKDNTYFVLCCYFSAFSIVHHISLLKLICPLNYVTLFTLLPCLFIP